MKILITGAAGYIGSVLVQALLEKKYHVTAYDQLNFGGESLLGYFTNPRFRFIKGDIRDEQQMKKALDKTDAVIHLAAIVGDPACAANEKLAEETNWNAPKKIFDNVCQSKRIKRFIFASTCSNYGKMPDDNYVYEDSPLNPVSLYARLKVRFEQYILSNDKECPHIPTSLRFATVYGVSPRMRFDLTVNEFIREVALDRELIIFGEQFWRPYCHVTDIARACVTILESPADTVSHQVFNVGSTEENYQKKMIADEILKLYPEARIKYVPKDEDPRDYRVDFSKIKNVVGFHPAKTVPTGIREVDQIVKLRIIDDPYSKKYRNT